MSDDRPLPNPHKRQWEKEEQGGESLLADRMARAMAEGRFEEFVETEFKDNENAHKLAGFMMQMTGMGPMPSGTRKPQETAHRDDQQEEASTEPSQASGIPEALAKIAADNGVEVEWVVSRALSLYIRDYRTTGRL